MLKNNKAFLPKIKISVLIPCYNVSKWVEKCLMSVVNQTYKNIEIICVDDCSTDNTYKILQKWTKITDKIKLYKNEVNVGLSENRNILISKATGNYFIFIDSDDWFKTNAIELFVKKIVEKNFPDLLIAKSFCYFPESGLTLPFLANSNFTSKTTNTQYLKNNGPFAWNTMINKSFYDKLNVSFDSKVRTHEDLGLMSYLIISAKKFSTLNKFTMYYRINKQGLVSQTRFNVGKNENVIKQMDNVLRLMHEGNFIQNKETKRIIEFLIYSPLTVLSLAKKRRLTKEDNDIFQKFKYEILDLIVNKYNIKIRFPWNSIYVFPYVIIWFRFRKILKHFKKLQSQANIK